MSQKYVQITEEQVRSVLNSGRRGPDIWARHGTYGELVAVWFVKNSPLAVKVYTSVRRARGTLGAAISDGRGGNVSMIGPSVSAPVGEDAIRVCVVDTSRPSVTAGVVAPTDLALQGVGHQVTLANCAGVAGLPIVRRVAGWEDRLRDRVRRAFQIAIRETNRARAAQETAQTAS